jgi:hypothetical protein
MRVLKKRPLKHTNTDNGANSMQPISRLNQSYTPFAQKVRAFHATNRQHATPDIRFGAAVDPLSTVTIKHGLSKQVLQTFDKDSSYLKPLLDVMNNLSETITFNATDLQALFEASSVYPVPRSHELAEQFVHALQQHPKNKSLLQVVQHVMNYRMTPEEHGHALQKNAQQPSPENILQHMIDSRQACRVAQTYLGSNPERVTLFLSQLSNEAQPKNPRLTHYLYDLLNAGFNLSLQP